jgi:hypothetical protein
VNQPADELKSACKPLPSARNPVNSLGGEFVYDDGAAIKKNDDVTGNGTIADIFIHDCNSPRRTPTLIVQQ